jgi:tetratricopeptide (TPR) repeat protein
MHRWCLQEGKNISNFRLVTKAKSLLLFATSLSLIPSLLLGIIFTFYSSSARAIDALNPQLNIPLNNGTLGEPREEADVLVRLGGQAQQQGRLEKAISYWLQALSIYQRIGEDRGIGLTYDFIGLAYGRLGRYREAEDALRRRLAVARDLKDFQGQIYGLNNVGTVLLQSGNLPAAQTTFREALAIARSVKNIAGEGLSLSNLALVLAGLGDYNQAIKQYEIALALRLQARDPLAETNTRNNLADAYRAIGRYEDALNSYRVALEVATEARDRAGQFRAYDGLAVSYSAVKKYDLAFKALDGRIALARLDQNLLEELRSLRLYAQLYQVNGHYGTARDFYERAIAITRSLGDVQQEALLINELDQIRYQRVSR